MLSRPPPPPACPDRAGTAGRATGALSPPGHRVLPGRLAGLAGVRYDFEPLRQRHIRLPDLEEYP